MPGSYCSESLVHLSLCLIPSSPGATVSSAPVPMPNPGAISPCRPRRGCGCLDWTPAPVPQLITALQLTLAPQYAHPCQENKEHHCFRRSRSLCHSSTARPGLLRGLHLPELQSFLRRACKLGAQAGALRARVQKNAMKTCTPDAKEPTKQPCVEQLPAYQCFHVLAQPGPPSLVLPYTDQVLAEMFSSTDTNYCGHAPQSL